MDGSSYFQAITVDFKDSDSCLTLLPATPVILNSWISHFHYEPH